MAAATSFRHVINSNSVTDTPGAVHSAGFDTVQRQVSRRCFFIPKARPPQTSTLTGPPGLSESKDDAITLALRGNPSEGALVLALL